MRYTIRFYDQKKPKQWEFSLSGFPEGDSLYDIIRAVCNENIVYVSYETDTEYKYKQEVYATTFGSLYGLKDCIALDFQLEPDNEFLKIRLDIKRYVSYMHASTSVLTCVNHLPFCVIDSCFKFKKIKNFKSFVLISLVFVLQLT